MCNFSPRHVIDEIVERCETFEPAKEDDNHKTMQMSFFFLSNNNAVENIMDPNVRAKLSLSPPKFEEILQWLCVLSLLKNETKACNCAKLLIRGTEKDMLFQALDQVFPPLIAS